MIDQHIVPSATAAGIATAELTAARESIETKLAAVHAAADESPLAAGKQARELRLEVMEEVRVVCDEIEKRVPADLWTLATYGELLFLDQNQVNSV